MSTINNIPFDINRTAVEKNASVKRGGTVPVFHSDAIKPVAAHKKNAERRSGDDRRRMPRKVNQNKRLLIQRRDNHPPTDDAEDLLAKAHKSGSIIDLEV